jgi:hypothetical protein
MKSLVASFAMPAKRSAFRCPAGPGINRVCIRIYESHGDDVPNAHTHALGRLTRALQDEGVEFLPDGGCISTSPHTMRRRPPQSRQRRTEDTLELDYMLPADRGCHSRVAREVFPD